MVGNCESRPTASHLACRYIAPFEQLTWAGFGVLLPQVVQSDHRDRRHHHHHCARPGYRPPGGWLHHAWTILFFFVLQQPNMSAIRTKRELASLLLTHDATLATCAGGALDPQQGCLFLLGLPAACHPPPRGVRHQHTDGGERSESYKVHSCVHTLVVKRLRRTRKCGLWHRGGCPYGMKGGHPTRSGVWIITTLSYHSSPSWP